MEVADIEVRAERILGPCPQLADLQFAHLVCQRLTWPTDVPVGLGPDLVQRERRVLGQVVEHLLARPAQGVHAGVDDEPAGPPDLVGQAAEVAVRILVDAGLEPEVLGVKRPSLTESREVVVAAELGAGVHLGRERGLEMMPRHRLVQGERRQRVEGPAREVVGVDPVDARLRAVVRGGHVAAGGVLRRHVIRDRLHRVGNPRQGREQGRQLAVHRLGDPGGALQQLLRGLRVEARIAAQEVEELAVGTLEAGLANHIRHLGPDPRDLAQADLVNLLRRHVEGGEPPHLIRVVGLAVRQVGGADGLPGPRQVLADEEVVETLVGRYDRVGDRGLGIGQDPLAVHLSHRRRHLLERRPEGAVLRVVDDVGGDRVLIALERHPRQGEAALDPRAHVTLLLLEVGRNRPHPGDVVVVVVRGPEGHRAMHPSEPHVEAGVRVERHLVATELEALHAAPKLALEHPGVDPVRRAEPGDVDFLEAPQHVAAPFHPTFDRLQADVGQLVVSAVIADARRELRALDESGRPVLVEQGVELVAGVGSRRAGGQPGQRNQRHRHEQRGGHPFQSHSAHCRVPAHGRGNPIEAPWTRPAVCRLLRSPTAREETVHPSARNRRGRRLRDGRLHA